MPKITKASKNSSQLVAIQLILFSLIIILIDQLSKHFVINFLLNQNLSEYLVTSFFNFNLVYNYGISFSIFNDTQQNQIVLSIVAIIIVALLLWNFIVSNKKKYLFIYPISMIVGGAIGNVIDRFTVGAVVDFLDFHIGNMHYPIFNLADSAIVCGAILLALIKLRHKE